MIRRYVWDEQAEKLIEIGTVREPPSGAQLYERAQGEYSENREGNAKAMRQAALERAERREFAHKKFGDERRWRE